MERFIRFYSTKVDRDQKYKEWIYKGTTFKILENNLILDNEHYIGRRFYNNGYFPMFLKGYEM